MSEKLWTCEECGKPLLPGHRIMHAAFGKVDEFGDPQVGDHYYMHVDCEDPTSGDDDDEGDDEEPHIIEDQLCQDFFCGSAPLGCADKRYCPRRDQR